MENKFKISVINGIVNSDEMNYLYFIYIKELDDKEIAKSKLNPIDTIKNLVISHPHNI